MGGTNEYDIFIRSDSRAVCPQCKGLCVMYAEFLHLHCNDCGSTYIYIGNTDYSERVMRYRMQRAEYGRGRAAHG